MNCIGGPHYGAFAKTIASILNDVSNRGRPPPLARGDRSGLPARTNLTWRFSLATPRQTSNGAWYR